MTREFSVPLANVTKSLSDHRSLRMACEEKQPAKTLYMPSGTSPTLFPGPAPARLPKLYLYAQLPIIALIMLLSVFLYSVHTRQQTRLVWYLIRVKQRLISLSQPVQRPWTS